MSNEEENDITDDSKKKKKNSIEKYHKSTKLQEDMIFPNINKPDPLKGSGLLLKLKTSISGTAKGSVRKS